MIQKTVSRLAAWTLGLAGVLGLSSSSARAEFFEYTSTVSISNSAGTFTPASATITNPVGGASATFLTMNGNQVRLLASSSDGVAPHENAEIGTNIVPLSLDATSGSINEAVAFNFTLNVAITNYPTLNGGAATAPPATFAFTGRLSGNIGNGAVNLDLLTFAPSPTSQVIDGDIYTLSLKNFASPGLAQNGALTLAVKAAAVPEPASMAMLGLGGLGALGMFRRRTAKASA